jgi:hypothetical protein
MSVSAQMRIRKQLATAAFKNLWNIWSNKKNNKTFRRRQLRSVFRVNYPNVISNAELYKRCNMTELQSTIRNARWRMLGYALRMIDDTPAKHAMLHYFDEQKSSFAGRPITTLPTVISKDIELAAAQSHSEQAQLQTPKQLRELKDLRALEALANDRQKWRAILRNMQVLALPKPEPSKPRSLRTPNNNNKQ